MNRIPLIIATIAAVLATSTLASAPANADNGRGRGHGERGDYGRRGEGRGYHNEHRGWGPSYYRPPVVAYPPAYYRPPVVYAPPPVYYAPPVIGFGFSFR